MQRAGGLARIVTRINRPPRREKFEEGARLHTAHLRRKAQFMRYAHAINFMPDLAGLQNPGTRLGRKMLAHLKAIAVIS
jgi:hypothetical protein